MERNIIIVILFFVLILVVTGCEDEVIIVEGNWTSIETDHFQLITTQNTLETIGDIKIANFWLEGIAMYYTWPSVYFNENNEIKPSVGYWHGQNVHNHLRENYLDNDKLSNLSPFIYNNDSFDNLDDDLSYPLAGSFVTYLVRKNHNSIEQLNKFQEYLKELNQCDFQTQALKIFEDIFNKSFSEQNTEWLNFLSGI